VAREHIATREVHVLGGAQEGPRDDEVVVEEPLEIRVAGDTVAITMRTPGRDHELALGFLFAEGIIADAGDLGRVAHCGRPDEEGYGNTIDALPGPGVALDPSRLADSRRGTLTTSACGVCGRRSIDDLLDRVGPLSIGARIPVARIHESVTTLRARQPSFTRTGGVHAAAILDAGGEALSSAEDVGRHNAVDKAVGALLRDGGRDAAQLLVVSGRVSFEIVQKAAVARIPVVTAVSAPTSLAVDLAERLGLTLCGFVRDGRANVYTHRERLLFG
jgi:FdhD protein